MGIFSKLFTPKYNPKASNYKMDTLEDINNIPVPTQNFQYNCDFTESIEYVLQKKATEFKKSGDMDTAIACLKKAIKIAQYAPMEYNDLQERLENYLKKARKYNDLDIITSAKTSTKKSELTLSSMPKMIEGPRESKVCSKCACYHGRIYAKNKCNGFPDMSIFVNYYNQKQCRCSLVYYSFMYGISTPSICNEKEMVMYSNRPFKDDRTSEEKNTYDEYIKKLEVDKKDRQDYDWIWKNLPDIAPKSFGGYRNMKNKNSANYQKLVLLAKEKGYLI